jgi:hypothetical protein
VIQAEDFNDGGNWDAYYTPAPGNAGDSAYRPPPTSTCTRAPRAGISNPATRTSTCQLHLRGGRCRWYSVAINARNLTWGQWISVYPSIDDKRTVDERYIFWGNTGTPFRDFTAVKAIYLSAARTCCGSIWSTRRWISTT